MRKASLLILVLGVSIQQAGCKREYEWEDLRRGSTNCVVAVFPLEATDHEVNDFLRRYIQDVSASAKGQPLKPGIGALIKRDVEGHIGYEICFAADASAEQVQSIRNEIKGSHALYKVLEGDAAEQVIYGAN